MDSLSKTQVASYHRDGYLFPLAVFTCKEVDGILARLESAKLEAGEKDLLEPLSHYLRINTHITLPFVSDVARNPKLLDRVESIMGPNLMLWSAEMFVKPAHSPKVVTWHQDLTYWGLGETENEMTAWIALSDVTVASGAMKFISESHKQRIQPHADTFDENNLLSRGQVIQAEVDESKSVDVVLNPGEVSFHHGNLIHASGPNRCDYHRVGLVLRFITPEVKQLVAKRDYAMLMRGLDETDHWIHIAPPSRNFDDDCIALHARVRKDQSQALAQGTDKDLQLYAGF